MSCYVDRLYHPTHYVTDLEEAERFFARVFGRPSIPLADHQDTRLAPPTEGYPRDYSIFTPIADVYFDCVDPQRYKPRSASAPKRPNRSRLRGISWGVQGIEELWQALRRANIRCTDQWGTPADGDEPPLAAFAQFPLIYTLPDDTGLSYEFLPTEWIASADVRGDPSWSLPAVTDADPLGIERCSHHTILTGDRDRALRLFVGILGGSVVGESRNDILGADSVQVELADAVFEFATPTEAGTPAMDEWRRRAPLDAYHALTWKVVALERTVEHLRACGVGLRHHDDETVITEPEDSIGIPWGFTTRPVPRRDPRERPSVTSEDLLLGFVGDVLIDRPDPCSATDHLAADFARYAAVLANCEAAYADDPVVSCNATMPILPPLANVEALRMFDVLSLANNHAVDAGHRGLLALVDRLRECGIATVGAGADIATAREPAVLALGGTTVGYLGYASTFPVGYEARPGWPGIVPMRGDDLYRPLYPSTLAPGVPPVIVTVPNDADLAALADDIARAKEATDVVVATFHWGDFSRPLVVTDHEVRTARFCIDHGADVVVGHHHHNLRGMVWYAGRPIFYGLGHFVFDMSDPLWQTLQPSGDPDVSYNIFPREGWPLLGMHADARMTAIAWVEAVGGAVVGAGFVPCRIHPDGQVCTVAAESAEGREIRDYVARSNALNGIHQPIELEPDTRYARLGSWRLLPPDEPGDR